MERLLSTDIDVVCLLSKLNAYEYIIVGSGFGGGILAETLAQREKKVLLIERGGPLFTTHILNTSRPSFCRGRSNSPEGNETVYDAIKGKVQTSESSEAYIGGPVYCLGGRSNVWGLWAPRIDKQTLQKYFPSEVHTYLQEKGGYEAAFKLMANGTEIESAGLYSAAHRKDVEEILKEAVPDATFDSMPVAAEFGSPARYRFPRGAYSTAVALLNRMYAKDQYLTVLMHAEVLQVNVPGITERAKAPNERSLNVSSLLVRTTTNERTETISTGSAKVILSAGAIGTASIALNSGFRYLNHLVGKGLIDHDVWFARFAKESPSFGDPIILKSMVRIGRRPALLTVLVNANFFLAGSPASLPPTQYWDSNGLPFEPRNEPADEAKFDTIAILFEFHAELDDRNEVLGLPALDPVIRVKRQPVEVKVLEGMEAITTAVRNQFIFGNPKADQAPAARPQLLGFGVFSHEVGTMRMDGPKSDGVLDENLQVKGLENLFVCDLSVFPVSPEANPSLTLAGLSLRLAEHLCEGVRP